MSKTFIYISSIGKMRSILLMVLLGAMNHATAQKDTSTKPVVTIVSSYKPTLLKAAKIGFAGKALDPDSSRIVRKYEVPVQNLMYVYQPISLKPLAIEPSETNDLFVVQAKAGFGNFASPLLQASLQYGNIQKGLVNASLGYTSSKTKRQNQQFSLFNAMVDGTIQKGKHEASASVEMERKRLYRFGYDPKLYSFSKDQVLQGTNRIHLQSEIKNAYAERSKLHYAPQIGLDYFTYANTFRETEFTFQAPVQFKISDAFDFNLESGISLTSINRKDSIKNTGTTKNNLIHLFPAIKYQDKTLKFSAGVGAISDNGKWIILPQIHAEYPLLKKNLILQAGWTGQVIKNSFRNIIDQCLFVVPPVFQKNTRETEWYGGIKSNVTKHLVFNAKLSVIQYKQFALFINDTTTGKAGNDFLVSYEPSMSNFRLHGDATYVLRDKLNLTAAIDFNGYAGTNLNRKAWNTLPLECHVTADWQFKKKLRLEADFYYFAGGKYLKANNESGSIKGAADLSVSANYQINKTWGAFINVNNIFGTRYQRWQNYPVLGIQAMAGVCWNLK